MVEVNAFALLTLFSITIIVGYVGSLIFHKTRIIDTVWLLIIGLLVGPVFGLVDRELFIIISPFLASLALLIILFDAGLNMKFYQVLGSAPRGLLLAVAGVVLSTLAVAGFVMYFMGFGLLNALFLGVILGGTCSTVILSIVGRLNINRKTRMMLSLESVFTDPLVIVVALALIGIMTQTSSVSPVSGIMSSFSIGAVIGLMLGVVWLYVLDKLKGRPFDYMLTLAFLFIIFVGVEAIGGSGAISALAFGLVLGNGKTFSTMLKLRKKFAIDDLLRYFQSEVTFFIRSFFFVYLGIIATINPTFLLYGGALALVIVVVRIVAVRLSVIGLGMSGYDKNIMSVLGPRGLAAAVLAQLPMTHGLPSADVISNLVFIVILGTVLYSTIVPRFIEKPGRVFDKSRRHASRHSMQRAEKQAAKLEKQEK